VTDKCSPSFVGSVIDSGGTCDASVAGVHLVCVSWMLPGAGEDRCGRFDLGWLRFWRLQMRNCFCGELLFTGVKTFLRTRAGQRTRGSSPSQRANMRVNMCFIA